MTTPPTDGPIDFAILTAIEVERRAVCATFGFGKEHRVKRKGRTYWRGRLPLLDGSSYEIVVAQSVGMGQVEATALTKDVLRDWQPHAAILVGIAATTDPSKVRLGDVVVGNSVWYYEHGKITPQGTRPQPEMMPADAGLLQHFTGIDDWDGHVTDVRPDGAEIPPKVHQGVIASGEKVIADMVVRDEIAAGHRKIIAIAMEEYGFSRAIWQSPVRVQHLVIRGICDDGSPAKNDDWHKYAATAAAGFARHFLLDRPTEPRNGLEHAPPEEHQRRAMGPLTITMALTAATVSAFTSAISHVTKSDMSTRLALRQSSELQRLRRLSAEAGHLVNYQSAFPERIARYASQRNPWERHAIGHYMTTLIRRVASLLELLELMAKEGDSFALDARRLYGDLVRTVSARDYTLRCLEQLDKMDQADLTNAIDRYDALTEELGALHNVLTEYIITSHAGNG
ncbi:phosphorylase family protein [Sorangium sp. So ce388]|uniref:5'-methylthioadenosine/S-adenosylhomocysteine nucleosidase family protein n=1 Tax=Sorangium sp. So ce388 TaxID=3133309 RepID=UPI003F5CAB79